jgi:hypothetical protein
MSEFQLNTPVVMFLFARPDHTRAVIETVRQAQPPLLLVVQDAPRAESPDEEERCAAVHSVVQQNVDWPCEIRWNIAPTHLGCGDRVTSGLDWAFDLVEEAIILEDDCVPAPSFFQYCQELLDRYRGDERIFAISGDNFQFGQRRFEWSYYYSVVFHCWGWASWRRSWKTVDTSLADWAHMRNGSWLEDAIGDEAGAQMYRDAFDACLYHGANTWDYQTMYSSVAQGRLNILPSMNLVTNIGFGPFPNPQAPSHPLGDIPAVEMPFPLRHPPFLMRDFVADRNFFRMVAGRG